MKLLHRIRLYFVSYCLKRARAELATLQNRFDYLVEDYQQIGGMHDGLAEEWIETRDRIEALKEQICYLVAKETELNEK